MKTIDSCELVNIEGGGFAEDVGWVIGTVALWVHVTVTAGTGNTGPLAGAIATEIAN